MVDREKIRDILNRIRCGMGCVHDADLLEIYIDRMENVARQATAHQDDLK